MKNKITLKITLALFILPIFVITNFGQEIYFVENEFSGLQSSDILGQDVTKLDSSSITGLYGVAADFINKKIYYSNVVTDEIFSINFDGSSKITLLNAGDGIDGPRGIAVDKVNNKLYWAESISGKIKFSDFDGNNLGDLVSNLSSPVDVALDLVNNKIYWSDNGLGQKKISRSNLDGSLVQDIVTGLDQVACIEIDVESNKLYWSDFGSSDKISRANTDGTSQEIVSSISNGSPRGITIDRYSGKIFWTDVIGSSISRIDLNGTSESTIISVLLQPIGISADNPPFLPLLAQLKIMLEGPFSISSNLMNTNLTNSIPLKSPYLENNRIVDNISDNIVDWVLVELRENINGPVVVSKSALLHKDGRIVADNGVNSTIRISAQPKPYYIVVKHRNHLPVISATTVNLTTE